MQTRLIFVYDCILIIAIAFLSCESSDKDIHSELEKFDSSLDSLIEEKTYHRNGFLVFQADTLHNNPALIEEICYQVIGNDSVKIDANCHLYTFDENHLVTNSSEDFMGNKFVQKVIYFQNNIDNEAMENLWSKKSDTVYLGAVRKYNAEGYLVKSIACHKSVSQQADGSIKVDDYRLLEIFKYNDHSVTTWTRRYFNKKYNIDSLRNSKVTQITTTAKYNAWETDKINYSYVRDEYGNWIVKRKKGADPDVYYRKYEYRKDMN